MKSYDDRFGYNFCLKADSRLGTKCSDETRNRMSIAQKNKDYIYTKEHRKAISKATKGENNPFYGKTHSEETKYKQAEVKRGSRNGMAKLTEEDVFEIKQLILKRSYMTKEIAEMYNVSSHTILGIISGKVWSHVEPNISFLHKKRVIKNTKDHNGENNPMFRRHQSEETKNKISEIHKASGHSRGENNSNAKLKESQVIEIKKMLQTTNLSHRKIGEIFNASKSIIDAISANRSWSHVQIPILSQL